VGPSVTVCYNDPHIRSEEELVNECQFLMRKGRWGRCRRMIGECSGEKRILARGMYMRSVADIPKFGDIAITIKAQGGETRCPNSH
jgi:hypothetical protein